MVELGANMKKSLFVLIIIILAIIFSVYGWLLIENTKLQFSELTDIKYVYYEYLEEIFKNADPKYVPYTLEHKKLFEYLHEFFDKN